MNEISSGTQTKTSQLLKEITEIINLGKEQAQKAANKYLLLTYWKIGQRISQEENYQSLNLQDLSTQLGMERFTLGRSIQFFNLYPTPPQNLSWSHYRELIAIKDESLRIELEDQANSQNLTRDQLVQIIKSHKNTNQTTKTITRPTSPTYLYKAILKEVVDGDTIIVLIDLGFKTFREQRIRLAQINCPEFKTPEGQKSYEYTKKLLSKPKFLMIKTSKIDIYGRYVGHVFFDPKNQKSKEEIFLEGDYLSARLVKDGMAEIY